jgi:hypothetical protein
VKIPAHAPLTKQAQRTQVSPGSQLPLRGLACEVGALGVQPRRSAEITGWRKNSRPFA